MSSYMPPKNWKIPEWDSFYKKLLNTGHFESDTEEEWKIIEKYCKNFRTAVDIGSHIGTTVCRYAPNFEKIHAIEPLFMEYLLLNTAHFNNVFYHSFAISDSKKYLEMFSAKKNSGMSMIKNHDSLQKITPSKYTLDNVKSIPAISLDELLGETEQDIDFIKIDTEGHILPVLKGATKLIKENKPLLQIELNNLCPNKKECINYLEKTLGYQFVDNFDVDCFYVPKK